MADISQLSDDDLHAVALQHLSDDELSGLAGGGQSYLDKSLGKISDAYHEMKTDNLAHINRDSTGQPSTLGQLNALGNAVKFVTQTVPGAFVPDSVKQVASQALMASPIGPSLYATGQVEKLGQQYAPDTTRAVNSLVNIASAVPAADGLGSLIDTGANIAKDLPNMAGALARDDAAQAAPSAPSVVPLKSQQLGDTASHLYDTAHNSGVTFGPQLAGDFSAAASARKIKGVQGVLHPEEIAFNNDLDFYNQFQGKNLTISDVQDLDQQLGRLTNKYKVNGQNTEYSSQINGLKYDLRDMAYTDNAKKYLIGGDQSGIQAMTDANKFYTERGKALDLEKIQANAALTDNPQAAIRRGILNLQKNDRKMKFYNEDDKAALTKARKTGVVGFGTSILGNGLVDAVIGGASGFAGGGPLGGIAGTIAGKAASIPFAKMGEAVQGGRVNQALGTMQSDLPEIGPAATQPASPLAQAVTANPNLPLMQLLNMPPAQAMMLLGLNQSYLGAPQ